MPMPTRDPSAQSYTRRSPAACGLSHCSARRMSATLYGWSRIGNHAGVTPRVRETANVFASMAHREQTTVGAESQTTRPPRRVELLDGDRRASLFELGLGGVGGVLVDLLEQRLGSAVDEVLGLLEAQAGHDLADDLDDADLLLACTLEDDVELRLLLGGLGG